MYIAMGILFSVCFLCGLLLLVPVRVSVSFSLWEGKTAYTVRAGLGFLQINLGKVLKNRKKQKNPQKEKGERKKVSLHDIEAGFSKGIDILRYLRKKFTVRLFSVKIRMGLGDAADTGIATGSAYAMLYNILGKIDRYFILKKHEVRITPVFQGAGLDMEFQGTFQLKLFYCLGLIQKIRKEEM